MDLGVLLADGFSGYVHEEKAGIGTVRQTDTSRRAHSKRMAAVDPLELVALGSAMGKGCEDQEARHEAEGSGRQGVSLDSRGKTSSEGLMGAINDST